MAEQQRQYDTIIVDAVRAIILKHTAPTRMYLFGSRVTGDARLDSDNDLAFDAPDADQTALEKTRNELEELHTLYRIDVANIAKADSRFANRVLTTGLVIYSATKELRAQDGLMYFERALDHRGQRRHRSGRRGQTLRVHLGNGMESAIANPRSSWHRCPGAAPRFQGAFAQGLLAGEWVWLDMIDLRTTCPPTCTTSRRSQEFFAIWSATLPRSKHSELSYARR